MTAPTSRTPVTRDVACSFCLRAARDVGTLVAGPAVYICDECVALCGAVIAAKPARSATIDPWEVDIELDALLEGLPRMLATVSQAERHIHYWVARARELGATWAQIGEALGMARQSAWERFSGEE
jgi:ClpX C4-type zinc finger